RGKGVIGKISGGQLYRKRKGNAGDLVSTTEVGRLSGFRRNGTVAGYGKNTSCPKCCKCTRTSPYNRVCTKSRRRTGVVFDGGWILFIYTKSSPRFTDRYRTYKSCKYRW